MPANRNSTAPILSLETLEPRRLLATLVVTTTADVIDSLDSEISLREAIITANTNGEDDVIELGVGTFSIELAGFGEDLSLTGDFDILSDDNHSLAIRGTGSDLTIIDARQLDRAFHLMGQSSLTLEDLTVENGDIQQRAVWTGRRGGAIKSTQSTLNLDSVVVRNSTAGASGAGGAIWVSGGGYSINGSSILSNSALLDGAALFARNATGSIFLSVLEGNSLHDMDPFSQPENSGIVSIHDGLLDIRRSKIDNNNAGTGITIFEGRLDLTHTRLLEQDFFSNPASEDFAHGVLARSSEVTVDDSRFTLMRGDAIRFLGSENDLIVTNSVFTFNNGSSISFKGRDLTVSDTEFLQDSFFEFQNSRPVIMATPDQPADRLIDLTNIAITSPRLEALVIEGESVSTEVNITGLEIVSPQGDSGADDLVRIEAKDVTMTDVSVPDLASEGFVIKADTLLIDNATLSDIFLKPALQIEAATAEIRNSNISDNWSGVVVAGNNSVLEVVGSQFHNNQAIGGPGPAIGGTALAWQVTDGQLAVYDSVFMENKTDGGLTPGDAISVQGARNSVLVANSTFANHRGASGIGISGENQIVKVANSVFHDNRGAAIYSGGIDIRVEVYSTTFARNGNRGGAVQGRSGLDLFITNSIMIGNGLNPTLEFSHIFNDVGTTLVTFTNIWDLDPEDGNVFFGGAANGNTDLAPVFVDYFGNDFHLQNASPLIGIGDQTNVLLDDLDLDSDGNTTEPLSDRDMLDRIVGAEVDMGAYENQSP